MSLLGALSGGFLGTLLLATALQLATALRLTRIDLPFLLGSVAAAQRGAAKAAGYALQVAIGLTFAVVYWLLFQAAGSSAWWLGGAFGVVHGLATAALLVPVVLPAVHPRLGTSASAADTAPALGRPGFLMLSYGPATPTVTVAGHAGYGLLVALLASGAA